MGEGDTLSTLERLPSQKFTEPPPRFSEGSLVRHLEDLGIGRPSTYASILKSLTEREYCTLVARTLRPKQRGQLVTALLTSAQLEQYVQTDFTARLEQQLDSISAGEGEPTDFLSSWWSEFNEAVTAVETADTLALREAVADKCAWTLFPSGCTYQAATSRHRHYNTAANKRRGSTRQWRSSSTACGSCLPFLRYWPDDPQILTFRPICWLYRVPCMRVDDEAEGAVEYDGRE